MERSILASVAGHLRLDYQNYEVIIINDGSTDRTLELLKETYDLVPEEFDPKKPLLCQGVIRGLYQSRKNERLRVIDKVNCGNKADALNAGISFARHELFCAVDADSLLERDALTLIVQPFVRRFDPVVAAGGTVRVINGSAFRDGAIRDARVSFQPLVFVSNYRVFASILYRANRLEPIECASHCLRSFRSLQNLSCKRGGWLQYLRSR